MDWLKKFFGDIKKNKGKDLALTPQQITKLYYLATVDTKTQLYNYRYFNSELKHELAISERYGRPISLILIDIDDFKRINDNEGYLRGDEILQMVATLIKSNVRDTDVAARFGGEEFIVLMPETKEEDAEKLADRTRGYILGDKFLFKYHITVSVGVAQNLPIEKDTSIEQKSLYSQFMPQKSAKESEISLFEKANLALKYAKTHGKNQTAAYSTVHKLSLLGDIKHSVKEPENKS